jgi:tetratricopeptide (TPR) repeat protein
VFPPSKTIPGGNRASLSKALGKGIAVFSSNEPWDNPRNVSRPALTVLLAVACLVLVGGCSNFVSQAQNAEGVRLFQRGQFQEALQEFQQAAYTDPNNADGYYNLAATYHRLGRLRNQPDDIARAETCYRQCLDRNPNHRDCHRGLAVLLAEQGKTEDAFRSLQNWADQQPMLAEPRIELARLHDEYGNRQAAMDRLVEAVNRDKDNPREWTALGKLCEQSGEYSRALKNYQTSLQLDSAQPDVANRVAVLQAMAARQTPTPAGPANNTPTLATPTPAWR